MAEIEIKPLTERLSDEEIEELAAALESVGAPRLPRSTEGSELTVAEGVDDEVLDDFLDRLEALDAACEIYLPIEFDGRVQVGDMSVGSSVQLLEALEEMEDDLAGEEDEDDEDDDEAEDEDAEAILMTKLRGLWKLMKKAAAESVDRGLPLHVQT